MGRLPLKAHQETEGLGWGRQSSHRYRVTLMLGCEVVVMGTLKIREYVFREGGRKKLLSSHLMQPRLPDTLAKPLVRFVVCCALFSQGAYDS